MKSHKHAKLIKAWADGAEIEVLDNHMEWKAIGDYTSWHEQSIYRIKPEQKQLRVLIGEFIEYGHFVKEGDKYEMAIVNGSYGVQKMYEEDIEDEARGKDWIVLDEYQGEIVTPMRGVR
jgi:hypothetical protein